MEHGKLKAYHKPQRAKGRSLFVFFPKCLARVDFPQYTHETGEDVVKETVETCFFMENRKLQFDVTRLQFHVAVVSNLARRSLFSAAMLFFVKVEVHRFRQKKKHK